MSRWEYHEDEGTFSYTEGVFCMTVHPRQDKFIWIVWYGDQEEDMDIANSSVEAMQEAEAALDLVISEMFDEIALREEAV